jgi:hypothetical protein
LSSISVSQDLHKLRMVRNEVGELPESVHTTEEADACEPEPANSDNELASTYCVQANELLPSKQIEEDGHGVDVHLPLAP